MVKKKGFWKKTGCILISASIILTGVTFFDSSTSVAELSGTEYIFTTGNNVVGDAAYDSNTVITVVKDNEASGAVIGNGAFANCTNLESVVITGDASIGPNAFAGCTKLREVTLGSVSNLDTTSFSGCSSLEKILIRNPGTYSISDGAVYSGTTLIYVPASKDSLTVKSGTTLIAENALQDSQVAYLEVPNAVGLTIADQGTWPKFNPNNTSYELVVESPNGANTPLEEYFREYIRTHQEYKNRIKLNFDNATDTPTQKWTISLAYRLLDTDRTTEVLPEKIRVFDTMQVNAGQTPSYSGEIPRTRAYEGYIYALITSLPLTFTPATEPKTYVVDYVKTNQTATTYKITHIYKDEAGKELGRELEDVADGEMPTQPAEKKTFDGKEYEFVTGSTTPAYVAVTGTAAYTHTYKATGNSGGDTPTPNPDPSKTYTVTVYDEFYKGDLNHMTSSKIRSVNKYNAGSNYSFSHASYNGYSAYGGRNQSGTVNSDINVYFFYLENGTAGKATDKPADKKSEINTKLTNKYVITEGANQTVAVNGGPVKIVCNGELEKLTGIFVDETKVDPSRYTVTSGSTILTFTGGFMKLFATGDHVVRFEYVDGYAETGLKVVDGKTTTTVTYKVSSDGSISSGHTKDATPKTADGFDSRYLLCLAIFLLGAGAMMLGKQKKLEAILAGERDEY
jgi:hypothetical protein